MPTLTTLLAKGLRALPRLLFMLAVAYPVVVLWLGIRVRYRERLPVRGPAIIVANHNSHLDFMALLSLFPLRRLPGVRPAAAADYFCRWGWLKWLATHFVGIIPVERGRARAGQTDPLEACYQVLAAGQILLIFPEGTRGQPEQLAELKPGVWHLVQRFPEAPVVPVFLYGLGRSLPRGSVVPVPFQVKVAVGRPAPPLADKYAFLSSLRRQFHHLQTKVCSPLVEEEAVCWKAT